MSPIVLIRKSWRTTVVPNDGQPTSQQTGMAFLSPTRLLAAGK
jgi:hypothetical protein